MDQRTAKLIKLAIDSSMFSIVISDASLPDLPLVYVNRQFEALTGYKAEEIIGRNCRFLQGPETNKNAISEISKAISRREPTTTNLLNYRKDGSKFWNRFQISPFFNEQGSLEGFMGIQVDMTFHVEDSYLRTERLKLETLGQIAGSVAHDFGNTLQPIGLFAEELSDICTHLPDDLREKAESYTAAILEQASIGSSISKQLLTYSNPSARSIAKENALDLFISAHRFATRMLPNKMLAVTEVETGFDKDLTVSIETNALSQALMNIFSNAAKATGGKGRIWVSLREEGGVCQSEQAEGDRQIRIDVRDNGCGISDQDIGRVFDPFFTTRIAGEGSGLGLYAVSRLAREWGGSVSIDSIPGEGTTVSLFVPARTGDRENG
jgi:PAS domain S-box-containing protein